ncbi:hypothetical protein ANCCAN_23998 [Ancylostoma caninum]|uniref:Uncharacterized protein n=1 Tax=Ancylostoma caninum TaxID=29170 RepID=A0A368FDT3_ANCCA|nr:hypothetical protein ANCCAN_23998 [Ancylostoma caninum]
MCGKNNNTTWGQILKHLPQKGDRVDVITASGRNDYNLADDTIRENVRVTPMDGMSGMLIDMVLRLKKEHSNQTKLIDISIECPDFKPSRICVDGSWYKIA